MKKNVYLIQVSAVYGENVKNAYLPYAAGCLAAYAFADEKIKAEYSLGRFIFMRENIDEAIASMEKPYFVGFSSYIWNMEYNKLFAKKLKEKYPDVIIAFGGHNMRPDGSDLDMIPEADIIMHGEGEETFKKLLEVFMDGGDPASVNNISFRKDGKTVTTEYVVPEDLSDYPSPYTNGYFADIIENSGIAPSVVWETNRGCPNHCAFCDWGELRSRVRLFPMERIKAELEWIVENKIEYIYCADANFGLFPRDAEIADMIIKYKTETGYPQIFRTNYTKNKDDEVFEISRKFITHGAGKSPTLSFQSLSPEVLENIGRSNMDLERFKKLMARYSEADIPVFSELILGLPGETYDSFADGICGLIESNQHTALGIYPCELLPNSRMGTDEFRNKYGIRTVRTAFTQYHTKPDEADAVEYSNIVIGTSTMNTNDWKRSYIFSVCVQAFHNLALTRAIAIYLYKEKQIPYKAFYEGLIEWMAGLGENSVTGSVFREVVSATDAITEGRCTFSKLYGENEHLLWSFEEYMFLALVKKADAFYAELGDYIAGFGIGDDIEKELCRYQRSVIKSPFADGLELTGEYDFYGYFRNIYQDEYAPLKKIVNTVTVKDAACGSWDSYARYNVWYGRRDDAQLYTGKKNVVTQTFGEKKKKNVYMVQATYLNGKTVYVPYAVGALIAYAWKNETVAENYNIADIIFLREDPDEVVAKLDEPFYVGFSTYMWNYEYNKVLAEKIRKAYPDCIIQFGGHQVPPGGKLLEEYPYIDIAMHNEGEVPFTKLLCELLKERPDFASIPNISYRESGKIVNNECVVFDGEDYPSPYLEGVFDKLIAEHPELSFDALLETNRGCPNHCTYCGWGMYKSKIRMFPMERIYKEIEWVSEHKIEFLGGADANFGLFERDEQIADWIIDFKKRTGYPDKFQVSYAKNSTERIFRMTRKLHEANMDKGVTLAFQSLSPEVLNNIGRSNIKLEYYSSLLKMYASAGIPTYSDLILGLPGETYDSFVSGVNTLLKAGQHSSLFIHILEWLPCSEMGDPAYMSRFGLEYTVVPLNQPHRIRTFEDEIREYSRIITANNTMDHNEWIRMSMFSTCVQCFHHLGLLEFVALYCYYSLGIEYGDLYDRLLTFIGEHPETAAGEVFAKIRRHFENVIENGGPVVFVDKKYGEVAWTSEEFAFLETVSQKDRFYDEIWKFVCTLGIDSEVLAGLMDYQRAIVKTVNAPHSETEFAFDFPTYFKNALEGKCNGLEKKRVLLTVDDPQTYDNWEDYARFIVWYGRRGGKNIYLTEASVKDL